MSLGQLKFSSNDIYFKNNKYFFRGETKEFIHSIVAKNSFYIIAQIFNRNESGGYTHGSWADGRKIFRENIFSIGLDKEIIYYITHKVKGVASDHFKPIECHKMIFGKNGEIYQKPFYDLMVANPLDSKGILSIGTFFEGYVHKNLMDKNGSKCLDQIERLKDKDLGEIEGFEDIVLEYYKKSVEMGDLKVKTGIALFYFYGIGVNENRILALDLLKQSADAGSEEALIYMCNFYFKTDKAVVLEYFEKAAKCGFRKAQSVLGHYYRPIDTHKAFNWYLQAALSQTGRELIKNNPLSLDEIKSSFDGTEIPEAMFRLACFFEEGLEVEKNNKLAFFLYLRASEKGDSYADFKLGSCYENGIGVDQDYKKAFQYYNKVAEAKCHKELIAASLYSIAGFYKKGLAVEINFEEALRLYKIGAEIGHSHAQHKLGEIYANGELGVEKNISQAIYWLERAVEQDFVASMCYLASLYLSINMDNNKKKKKLYQLKKAFQLFKKAADMGFTIAEVALSRCYIEGTGILKNFEEAKKYATLAAKKENPEAIFILGLLCISINPHEAMEYFLVAAEKKFPPAMEYLSEIYRKGIPGVVKVNLEESHRWAINVRDCLPYYWEDSISTGNTRLYTNVKYEISEKLKFWLNSVVVLSEKNKCSVIDLNLEEIEEYAKELKNLHEKKQAELDLKCAAIREEYRRNITFNKLVSEFNVQKMNAKVQKQEAATPAKKTSNASKSKKAKAKAKARAKAKGNSKQTTSQTKTNVSSTQKNSQIVKKPLESKNLVGSVVKLLEKLNKNKLSYQALPRVSQRWSSTNLEHLRNLTDVVNGQIIKRYQSLSDEELLEQRALHFLPDVEKILSMAKLREIFSVPVENGAKVLAKINFGNGKSNIGMISFGINENKNTEEKHVLYHRYMNLEEGVDLITLCNPIQEDSGVIEEDKSDWTYVSNTTFDIFPEGLKVIFKGEDHSLILFPKNYEAWYNLCGITNK